MGLCRSITNALLGPFLIYGLLLSHTAYRMLLEQPEPFTTQDFPKEIGIKEKDDIIASRKPLIKATIQMLQGKYKGDFVEEWCTDDIEFEDFLQKIEGEQDMRLFINFAAKILHSNDIKINAELHGIHEIVMDWTMTMRLNVSPKYPITLPMRTHILLEPPSTKAGKEKIFRIYEEWYGNKQLNEKTTFPILGRIHQKLRRFTGYLEGYALRSGWL